MTAPLKPWEIRSNVEERSDSRFHSRQPSVRFRIPPGTTKSTEKMNQRDSPPPIPSRQRNDENRISNSMYGSYHGTPSYGMYGSSYGGYGMTSSPYWYNRPMGYGTNNISPSTFTRRAEDSCQPAFDSVQSIVQAFASIATMLDSTFFAVHSSFRAVLGVADQLSSLRTHITNTLGALTIFKIVSNIFRRIMRWIRYRRGDMEVFESEAWTDAAKEITDQQAKKKSKSWPVVLFFAVVLGTPWIIWKLLQAISNDENVEDWIVGRGEHFEAEAEYDFEAEKDDEVSFQAGDSLRIAPKQKQPHVRGWLLASADGKTAGLVPANHIKILGRKRGYKRRQRGRIDGELLQDRSEEISDERDNATRTRSENIQIQQFDEIYEEDSTKR